MWNHQNVGGPQALLVHPHGMGTQINQGWCQNGGEVRGGGGGPGSRWYFAFSLLPGLTGCIPSLHSWGILAGLLEFRWPPRSGAGAGMFPCGGSRSLRAHQCPLDGCALLVLLPQSTWGCDGSICRRGRSTHRSKGWPEPGEWDTAQMSQPQPTLPTFLLQPHIGCRKGRRWRPLREEGIPRLCQGRWHSRQQAQGWSTRGVLHTCPHKNVSSYRGSWAWTPTHHSGWPLSLS